MRNIQSSLSASNTFFADVSLLVQQTDSTDPTDFSTLCTSIQEEMGRRSSVGLLVPFSHSLMPIQMFSSHHGSHSNELALEYFDFAYPLIYHRHWPSIRLALLSVPKPVALLNPYSTNHDEVKQRLSAQGALDLLRFDNEQVQKSHAMIQDQIGNRDEEFRVKRLLEQQERRRLLGTSELVNAVQEDEDEEEGESVEKEVDIDEDINTFNQPAPVQNINDIYQKALEQQV